MCIHISLESPEVGVYSLKQNHVKLAFYVLVVEDSVAGHTSNQEKCKYEEFMAVHLEVSFPSFSPSCLFDHENKKEAQKAKKSKFNLHNIYIIYIFTQNLHKIYVF